MKYKKFIIMTLCCIFIYCFKFYKENSKWSNYFKRTSIRPPNSLVLKFFEKKLLSSNFTILDLGAGNGSDSIYLLNQGFNVYSVDFFEESIKRIIINTPKQYSENIKVIKSSFQNLDWKSLPKFDCIIAINSISFIPQKDFEKLWKKMTLHLKEDGYMIIRLFGNNLKWPDMNNMTLVNEKYLNELTKDFLVLDFQEEEKFENSNVEHSYSLILKKKFRQV